MPDGFGQSWWVLGQGIQVGHQAVERLMQRAGFQGLSGRPKYRKTAPQIAATDRVKRQFAREEPDQLWVTDIERHEALFNRAVMKGHRQLFIAVDS